MSQEKRVLVAFALSFAVLLVWRALFFKEVRPPVKPGQPAQQAQPAKTAANLPAQPEAKTVKPVELPVAQGGTPREIVVEGGGLYRVTLSNQGAVVKSWVLEKYRDAKEKPLDVVNSAACEKLGYPMSLNLESAELSGRLNSAIYVVTPRETILSAPTSVEFLYSDGKIQVRKKFSFDSGYQARVEVSVFDGQRFLPVEAAWPGGFGDQSLSVSEQESLTRAVFHNPEGLQNVPQGKVKEDRMIPGPLTLSGLEDRYFAGLFLPGSPDEVFRFGRRSWAQPNTDPKGTPRPLTAILGSPSAKPLDFRLFVGPKDLDVLHAVNPPLDSLVDFGWFSFIAKPLFIALRYIYDHWIHNYGWAIILLTILINLGLFPLKLKSIRSAQEMQKIAPLVKSIQERYKQYKFNDPRKQRMNQEVMKLYQEHHINPLGGCLPMALQIPFLYGFYNVLSLSIELRHTPWLLWIKDLSAPDPLYILPIVMTVTMFILQKMTPMTTPDPAQQRMMLIMPLFFGFMFFRFASGLVLYWLTSNVVGIAQQSFVNRMMPASQLVPVLRKPSPAKE